MKKILFVIAAICFAGVFNTFVSADSGYEGATRIERGRYVQSRVVSISSFTATAFVPATVSRPDSICKNVSSFVVYVGSAAASDTLNVIGLPLGASEYLKLDGSFTGAMYATSAPGTSGVKIVCLDGMVP